jgi:hypothetical protein
MFVEQTKKVVHVKCFAIFSACDAIRYPTRSFVRMLERFRLPPPHSIGTNGSPLDSFCNASCFQVINRQKIHSWMDHRNQTIHHS